MTDRGSRAGGFDNPARYRVSLRGRLSEACFGWVSGLEIVVVEGVAGQPPPTVLTGLLDDQAALMGLLEHLYARGIPLLRVERLDG